ncbi:MAG: zinc-binding dehydrogenase [Actinomycetota bacterium]|nr:zinc-binding dehydrogenase [Actinomycetota bacterium]
MRALVFSRSLPRYAAARVAGTVVPGMGAAVGPLSLTDLDEPDLPAPGWRRVRPRLSGICGSDLATVDGRSSRYFEPIVSFPFVPGHEVVADLAAREAGPSDTHGDQRVVIEPVLGCAARGISPPCRGCADGSIDRCERIAFGQLEPGLQSGYCADTGGGWSTSMVAHESQIHPVPPDMSDEAAVMVEPAACAIHGVVGTDHTGASVLVLGAGTLGLCAVAALRRFTTPATVIVAAKYPEQRSLARQLGADVVAGPAEARRAVRRATGSLQVGDGLSGGVDMVIDCVGSESSIGEALCLTRPGGTITMLGMPGRVSVDLTALWQRQINLCGSYAYGVEHVGEARPRTFDLAFDLVADAGLERLVSAWYPLDRYRDAVEHAANAGRRGATKVVFDMRGEKRR